MAETNSKYKLPVVTATIIDAIVEAPRNHQNELMGSLLSSCQKKTVRLPAPPLGGVAGNFACEVRDAMRDFQPGRLVTDGRASARARACDQRIDADTGERVLADTEMGWIWWAGGQLGRSTGPALPRSACHSPEPADDAPSPCSPAVCVFAPPCPRFRQQGPSERGRILWKSGSSNAKTARRSSTRTTPTCTP